MDLQRRCDPQPPRAPQEEVTLLLSCSLSFLSVSTSLSVLSFLQFCLRLFPLSSLSLWPSSPTCLSPRPPPPSSRLCAASPVTQRLSKASLSFLHCHSLSLSTSCFPQSPSLLGVSFPFLWESPKAGSARGHKFLGGRTPSAGAHEVYTFRCWSLGQPAQVSASCLPIWQAS